MVGGTTRPPEGNDGGGFSSTADGLGWGGTRPRRRRRGLGVGAAAQRSGPPSRLNRTGSNGSAGPAGTGGAGRDVAKPPAGAASGLGCGASALPSAAGGGAGF